MKQTNMDKLKDVAHQAYCDWQGVPNTGLNAEHLPWLDELVTSTYLQAVEDVRQIANEWTLANFWLEVAKLQSLNKE